MDHLQLAMELGGATSVRPRHTRASFAEMIAVEVAIAVLRRGLPIVVLSGTGGGTLASAVEASPLNLAKQMGELTGSAPRVIWSFPSNHSGTGCAAIEVLHAELVDREPTDAIIVDHTRPRDIIECPPVPVPQTDPDISAALLHLVKLAGLLPVMLIASISGTTDAVAWAASIHLPHVTSAAILAYQERSAESLLEVSRAVIPLSDAPITKFIAFRPECGGLEHIAIVIGSPEAKIPVLARIHSACLTGDLFGSLRCDCGDQLRGAISAISHSGGGVLLYLAQEGRGIGLVNKLRSYALQDRGFDTIDANFHLGFEADERVYRPAVEIFRKLGFTRLRLMTNNPQKTAALERYGIDVVERVPHVFAANPHNSRYLRTKAVRSGHNL